MSAAEEAEPVAAEAVPDAPAEPIEESEVAEEDAAPAEEPTEPTEPAVEPAVEPAAAEDEPAVEAAPETAAEGEPSAEVAPDPAAAESVEEPAAEPTAQAAAEPAAEGDAPAAEADTEAPETEAPAAEAETEAPAAEAETGAAPPEAETKAAAAPEVVKAPTPEPEPVKEIVHDTATFVEPVGEWELNREASTYVHCLGYDSFRKNNIHFLSDDVILYCAGKVAVLYNTQNQERIYVPSLDGGGIGCCTVHPSRKYFAVGEKCAFRNPNIYIYEYPSLKIFRVLTCGTEAGYADLDFSLTGDRLASVGGKPDYMLTVWNWERETTMLRTKAFGQDVARVCFSVFDEGRLITGGTGHIKFWKMASTFTGIKLKGEIGKFGNVELSDTCAFTEFPDGKRVCGTELGQLLVWDGNLIKVEFRRDKDVHCHDGLIEVLKLDYEKKHFVSGGHDGYLRFWSFDELDQTDPPEDGDPIVYIKPLREIFLGENVQVRGFQYSDTCLIQNMAGGMIKLALDGPDTPVTLGSFMGGAIGGMDCSPCSHLAATTGDDCTVRVYDYVNSTNQLCTRKHNAPGSCIKWVPLSVDPLGSSFTCGFTDGMLRIFTLNDTNDSCNLSKVCKPHDGTVRQIEFSPDSMMLATMGDDGNVFFFSVTKAYEPLGFVAIPEGKIVSICWRADSVALLVCCDNGAVLELDASCISSQDTSETYELQVDWLKYSFIGFKPIQPKRKKKKKEDEGDEDASPAAAEGEDAEDQWEDDPDAYVPPMEIGQLVRGMYLPTDESEGSNPSNKFALFFDESQVDENRRMPHQGACGGSAYICHMDAEEAIHCLPLSSSAPIVTASVSHSNKFMLFGTTDGVVHIRSANCPFGYLKITSHDMWTGSISSARTSYDDQFLLSTGADSNFHVHALTEAAFGDLAGFEEHAKQGDPLTRTHPIHDDLLHPVSTKDKMAAQEAEAAKKAAEAVLSAEELALQTEAAKMRDPPLPLPMSEVEDMQDSAVYSIQEAKLKTEEDKLIAAAEAQKDVLRGHIATLREELLEQLEANKLAPEAAQLQRVEFDVDPEFKRLLRLEGDFLVSQMHKELAWDSERKRILMQKLRNRYLEELAVESIELHSFLKPKSVRSFRTARLPEELQTKLHEVYDLMKASVADSAAAAGAGEDAGMSSEQVADEEQEEQEVKQLALGTKKKELTKEEERRRNQELKEQKRAKRRKQWDELFEQKPATDYEPPEDIANFVWAQNHYPDKKLKMDDDYIVPEEQRVNTEKKKRQMLLMEESVSLIKAEYNERFLGLRDLKRRIIEHTHRDNKRLDEIESEMAKVCDLLLEEIADYCQPEDRFAFSLDKQEFPELRDEYSKKDLEGFEVTQAAQAAADIAKQGGGGGMGSFGGDDDEDSGGESGDDEAPVSPKAAQAMDPAEFVAVEEPVDPTALVDLRKDDRTRENLSALEKIQFGDQLYSLQYERRHIFASQRRQVAAFDDAIEKLVVERFRVQGDLKMTELRMLVLNEELQLLQEFDKKDQQLAARQQKKLKEKQDIERQYAACKEAADAKNQEAEALVEKQHELETEFDMAVPPRHVKREELLKVFRKKIKRRKKPLKDDEDEDYDSEEFDEESESDDDDDDDDSEEEEICPDKVDKATWEKVLELRERRLDHDEVMAEFKAGLERLNKESDQLTKKSKVATTEQQAIEKDIEIFQNEKQQRFNALDVVVLLSLDQLQCLVDSRLPEDMSECIIFTNNGLESLILKCEEIKQTKQELRSEQKEIKKLSTRLGRQIRIKTAEVAELAAKCTDVQVLKFGKEIDLEQIEKASINKEADELRDKLEKHERERLHKVQQLDEMIRESKKEQSTALQKNTDLLKHMGDLTEAQQKLEVALNASGGVMNVDHDPHVEHKAAERAHMMDLVQMQANEIDALKAEINMLRRKGGHVYTPIQKRVASSSMRTKPGTGQVPVTAGSSDAGMGL